LTFDFILDHVHILPLFHHIVNIILEDDNAFWFPHNSICNQVWNLYANSCIFFPIPHHIHIFFWKMKMHSNFPIIFIAIGFEIFVNHVHILHILHVILTFLLGRMIDFDFFSRLISLKFLSFTFMCFTHYLRSPNQHSSWKMMMLFDFSSRLVSLKSLSFIFMCLAH